MIRDEAIKIMHRLDGAFQYTQKLNENYVRDEYINILKNIIVSDCNEVIDNMVMSNKKELPTPGELLEACKVVENDHRANQKLIQPDETCYVCEGKGFITYKDKQFCDYLLYCTECDKGNEFKYQGKDCKRKSEYYTDPVTKYFDVEKLRSENMFKSNKVVSCPDNLKQQLRKIGVRV